MKKSKLLAMVARLVEQSKKDGIQKIVMGAVISNGADKVLCVKRHSDDFMPGLWELPSGNMDKGETPIDCLVRETREETGLTVNVKAGGVIDYVGSFDYTSGSGKKARQLTFVVKPEPGFVKLDPKEHEGYAWLSSSELDNYKISNETKAQIRSALASSQVPVAEMEYAAYAKGIKRCVVGAIIQYKDKALIVKRASDDFMGGLDELPSGKVDAGESLATALIREIQEETGLEVFCIKRLVGTFDYKSSKGENRRQFTFLVDVKGLDTLKLDPKEHEGYAWATLKEVQDKRYNLSEETAAQLITALSDDSRKRVSMFSEAGAAEAPRPKAKAKV